MKRKFLIVFNLILLISCIFVMQSVNAASDMPINGVTPIVQNENLKSGDDEYYEVSGIGRNIGYNFRIFNLFI